MRARLQAWQTVPSILGRSVGHSTHAVQHHPSAPGHDLPSRSIQAQQLPGVARVEPAFLSNEASGEPSSRQREQAEPGSAPYAGASQAEVRPHVSSSMTHGPLVHLGGTSESALGEAGSGLSLSDGDASTSVLSSLGEASDFDADVEHSADAAEADIPEMTGHHLLQSPTATLAGAASHGSSSAPAPARRSVHTSPFQHTSEQDLQPSQGVSSTDPSAEDATGPEAQPGSAPERALQQGLSGLSEEPSEVVSATSLHGRVSRPIQAASSDLMEAWNEQEQLEKQSNATSQLHSRLSLEESDLALSDLAELEQASSVLDSMVESAELVPHQHSSLGPAPQQKLDSQRYELDWGADNAPHAESQQSSSQSQSSYAAEHDQQQVQDSRDGSGHALPKSADKQTSAGSIAERSVPTDNLSFDSMQLEKDYNSAAQKPSPSIPSAVDVTLEPSSVDRAVVDPVSTMPVAEALRLRPADNAFREGHEPETARGPSRSDMYQEYGSAGDASVEHDQQSSDDSSSLVTQMQTAAEQYVGQPPIPQMQSDDEKPDLRGASSFTEETRYAMQSHAKPDLAVSGQADRQEHATELVHEDIIRPDDAAELGQGADRLAYAEALERALATGAPLASESLGADMAHNSHLTKHTIQAPMLGLRSPCGQQVMSDCATFHANTQSHLSAAFLNAGDQSEDAAQHSADPLLRVR